MTRDGKLRAGRTLLAGSYATLALLMIFGAPNHAVDPAWSRHAEVHLQQARAWLVGLCLLSELLVAIPLRRREPWAWWALLLSALMAFGGYFAPSFMVYHELPGLVDTIGLGALFLGVLAGLALARPSLARMAGTEQRPRQRRGQAESSTAMSEGRS